MSMQCAEWDRAVSFHGHTCPGLAIGFRAVQAAREKLGIRFSVDEEVVCVTENDACGVDAVQALAGCSMGKGNLIYRETGKMAFSFFVRASGENLRMILKPLHADMSREEKQEYLLGAETDEIFDFMKPAFALPETARVFTSLICDDCGESAPEPKMRLQGGRTVCLDCFQPYDRGWH